MTKDDEKKIIVDEDWKTQVERERETFGKTDDSPVGASEAELADMEEFEMPPASLEFLVSTLAAQTMVALGKLPDPTTGQPTVRLHFARHHIDMLSMVQEKTKGNVDAAEAQMLEDALHQLRLMFVQTEALRT